MFATLEDKAKHDTAVPVDIEGNNLNQTTSVVLGAISPVYLDPELEQQTLRKFDMILLPQLAMLVIIAYLDRTNIGEQPLISLKLDSIFTNCHQEMPPPPISSSCVLLPFIFVGSHLTIVDREVQCTLGLQLIKCCRS